MDDIQNLLTALAIAIQFLAAIITIYGLLRSLFFRPRIQMSVVLEAIDFLETLPPKPENFDPLKPANIKLSKSTENLLLLSR